MDGRADHHSHEVAAVTKEVGDRPRKKRTYYVDKKVDVKKNTMLSPSILILRYLSCKAAYY